MSRSAVPPEPAEVPGGAQIRFCLRLLEAGVQVREPVPRPMSTVSRDVVIVNPQGLHARPAMVFAETANQFKAAIRVARPGVTDDSTEVDGKSLIQMISLEAAAGATLRIRAEGDDADAAVEELARLVENGFGED